MLKTEELVYKGAVVSLELAKYAHNNQKAMTFSDEEGIPYFVATLCVEDKLEDDEVAIKDYSENSGVLEWLIKNELVHPPHNQTFSGYAVIPICRLTQGVIELFEEQYSK
ncbi:hypothetical protein [Rossellomorea marisflavi]|uniref:hypothetical protein n=1 Tax=Rossellomorea marisflavi TaxID=189381 RepID=UPI003F9F6ABB